MIEHTSSSISAINNILEAIAHASQIHYATHNASRPLASYESPDQLTQLSDTRCSNVVQPAPSALLATLPSKAASSIKILLTTLHFFFPHELLPALDLLDRGLLTKFALARPEATTIVAESGTSEPIEHEKQGNAAGDSEVWYVQSASAVTETRLRRNADGGRGRGQNDRDRHSTRLVAQTGDGRRSGGRFRNALRATDTYYEVRLDSWNCSCAAFIFGALKASGVRNERKQGEQTALDENGTREAIEETEQDVSDNKIHGKRKWSFGGIATKTDVATPVCKHILAAVLAKAAADLFRGSVEETAVERNVIAGWAAGWGDYG